MYIVGMYVAASIHGKWLSGDTLGRFLPQKICPKVLSWLLRFNKVILWKCWVNLWYTTQKWNECECNMCTLSSLSSYRVSFILQFHIIGYFRSLCLLHQLLLWTALLSYRRYMGILKINFTDMRKASKSPKVFSKKIKKRRRHERVTFFQDKLLFRSIDSYSCRYSTLFRASIVMNVSREQ